MLSAFTPSTVATVTDGELHDILMSFPEDERARVERSIDAWPEDVWRRISIDRARIITGEFWRERGADWRRIKRMVRKAQLREGWRKRR